MPSIELVDRNGYTVKLDPVKLAEREDEVVMGVAIGFKERNGGILFVSASQTNGKVDLEAWRINREVPDLSETEGIPAVLNGKSLRIDRRFTVAAGLPRIDGRRAYSLRVSQ